MSDRKIHIISFDIPYPPNYGGVIDVYYKIRELRKTGIGIYLHCFEYPGRERKEELNELCERVWYYPRRIGMRAAFHLKPYIVYTRKSDELICNLISDESPILFEGLHSCYYLNHPLLKNRFKIYRESNIEHHYYLNLGLSSRKPMSKAFYLAESIKLRLYQRILNHASLMLVVSQEDVAYLKKRFPGKQIEYLPSFHGNNEVTTKPGKGKYVLYHGNLEVPENERAALYLLRNVVTKSDHMFRIAGMNPTKRLIRAASQINNAEVYPNPDNQEMNVLIREAQVNLLITFQATGLKLKLINALFNGRHCIVNDKMINGIDLAEACSVANNPSKILSDIRDLMGTPFLNKEISEREKTLEPFRDEKNSRNLVELVFPV